MYTGERSKEALDYRINCRTNRRKEKVQKFKYTVSQQNCKGIKNAIQRKADEAIENWLDNQCTDWKNI